MIKEKLIHSVIKTMPVEYHENVVEQHMNAAFNEILSKKFWTFEQLDSLADTYDAILATENGLLAAPLGVPIISLPYVTDSLLSVRQPNSTTITFVPITEGASQVFAYDNDADEPVGYWLSKGKVFFEDNSTMLAGDTVLLRQVVPFTEHAWGDEIAMPGDLSTTLLRMTKQSLMGKQPGDQDDHYNDYKE